MARAAKAYVLGEPFQSKRAAERMTRAVNIYTEKLRAALAELEEAVSKYGITKDISDLDRLLTRALPKARALISVIGRSSEVPET